MPKSNHCIKREESTYLFVKSFLTGQNLFVFYEGTTAAGITLNDVKLGMLCGNHIYIVCSRERMNIDEFRQDLRNESMSDADVLNKYILCDNPVIFRDNVGLYSKLKTTIAGHFSVDITSLHMVGSAKLGFSVAPHQLWKPFGEDSDIDIVIISEVLFDGFWQRLSDLSAGIYDRSEQEEHKFDASVKSLPKEHC